MRADLHVHTVFSRDSLLGLEDLVEIAIAKRIDCVAITDHNTIDGAVKLAGMNPPFKVIIGEEILTREGEIIGLFLWKEVPAGRPVFETIELIREQQGLAVIPHPFDRLRHHALESSIREKVASGIDLIEGLNGRTVFFRDDRDAAGLAGHFGKPVTAGSDCHTKWELGRCGLEMEDFNDQTEFLHAVSRGRYFGRHTPPWIHLITKTVKYMNRLGLRPIRKGVER